MTNNFRALCAELVDAWLKGDDIVGAMNRARAALADEPAVPEGKKPTRDELWELWLRLNNELPDRPAAVAEFWEHAQIDARARAALADVPDGREPAAVITEPSDEELLELAAAEMDNSPNWEEPEYSYEAGDPFPYEAPGVAWVNYARAVLARYGHQPAPPAEGDVAELVAWLQEEADDYECIGCEDSVARCTRAAELLQRQALVPVSVSERPWEREGWCDVEGRFWAEHISRSGVASWRCAAASDLGGWAVRCLPAHALPLPEVGE